MPSHHVLLDERAQDPPFREARTTNGFTDESVSDEQVAAHDDLVTWGPTSFLGVRAIGVAAGSMTGCFADKATEEFLDPTRHRALDVVNIGKPGPDAYVPWQPRLEYNRVFTTH